VSPELTPGADVPSHPALAPWCRVVADGGRILFEHGGSVVTLEGRATEALLPSLIPLLDGTRTTREVCTAVGEPVAPAVEKALTLLAAHQLLVDGEPAPQGDATLAAAASFAAAATRATTPDAARQSLEASRAVVIGSGEGAAEAVRQLGRSGVGIVAPGDLRSPAVDLVVAVPDRGESGLLDDLNRRCLEREQAWLQILPFDGRFLVVGPLFLPGASACRTCYRLRRGACSGYEDDFPLLAEVPVAASAPHSLGAVAAGLAAVLAIRWLTVRDPTVPGSFYTVEAATIVQLSAHRTLRVPRCPDCGPPEHAMPSPWFAEPR
jgi:bacteriocin biosynthesis cyclodehydratase domain-containing protein